MALIDNIMAKPKLLMYGIVKATPQDLGITEHCSRLLQTAQDCSRLLQTVLTVLTVFTVGIVITF